MGGDWQGSGDLRQATKVTMEDAEVLPFHATSSGYAVLAAALEKDDALCRTFFKNLSLLTYGGARLPDAVLAYSEVEAPEKAK